MNNAKVLKLCERIYDLAEQLKYETFDAEIQFDADRIMDTADEVISYVEEIPEEIEVERLIYEI